MSADVHEVWAHDPATQIAAGVRIVRAAAGRTTATLTFMTPDGWRAERTEEVGGGAAHVDAHGTTGHVGTSAWDLSFAPVPGVGAYGLGTLAVRARLLPGALHVPGPSLVVSGTVTLRGRQVVLRGAPGAHLRVTGTASPSTWAAFHAPALGPAGGSPSPGDHLTALTALVDGRPVTLVRGRLLGTPFRARSPLAVRRAASVPATASWALTAQAGRRRVVAHLATVPERLLAGVVPEAGGTELWCYNSPMADLRLELSERGPGRGASWRALGTLEGAGTTLVAAVGRRAAG